MHESLVGVLNRRFVSSYFNANSGPGTDPTAKELLDEINVDPNELSYGAIITPSGERLSSFGYSQDEFYRKIDQALTEHPEFAALTPDEEAAFARAEKMPADLAVQLAAAQIHLELLDFDAGEGLCDRFLARPDLGEQERARALAMKGHVTLLDLRSDRRSWAREILMSISGAPGDIADDIATDLIACDVSVAPTQAFYGGWQMDPAAAPRHERTIREWLQRDDQSNRRGEMLFYLGLSRLAQDDLEGANEAWSRHVGELPEDRYALLSRLHNSEYIFSPTGPNTVTRTGGVTMIVDTRPGEATPGGAGGDEARLVSLITRLAASGGNIEIRGDKVFVGDEQLSEDDARIILEAIRSPGAKKQQD